MSGAKRSCPNSGCETFRSETFGCETSRSNHFMIVKLPGSPLWLWHSLGPLYDYVTSWGFSDCETSWSLLMIVMLPVPLYDFDTSCASMIVTLPEPIWLWHTSWLWNFLWPLYDRDTTWSLFMIVTFLYYHINWLMTHWFDIIQGNMILLIKNFNLEMMFKNYKLSSPWPWPTGVRVGMVLRKTLDPYLSSDHIRLDPSKRWEIMKCSN